MQTLKTAIVVVLLLVVFYGVYEMLNRPPVEDPPAVAELSPDATAELDIEMGDFSGDLSPVMPADPASAVYDPMDTGAGSGPSIPEPPSYYDPSAATPPPSDPTVSVPRYQPPATGATPEIDGAAAASAGPPAQYPAQPQPPASDYPVADSEVMAIPGRAVVQHNPFVNEAAVPKPAVPGSGCAQLGARAYQRAVKMAESLIAEGDYRAALSTLSVFYNSADLTADDHRKLIDLLDPLAGQVIYSREHVLERPYRVGRNETLMDVAQQFNVPYFLLQKINGIENPNILLPGTELKIVKGPFRAEVDLDGQELTLFLDRLYAGRFPITLGSDLNPQEGEFQIREKRPGKTYFSLDGRTIPAESPANPYGGIWLDLGREVCIHGTPDGGAEQQRGCISLSPRDAEDVYSILSVGSKIRILR